MEKIYEFIDEHAGEFVEECRKFLQQPSISVRNEGIKEASGMLKDMMVDIGIQAKICPLKEGHPVVYGELKSEVSDRTLLVYSHYDVVPPEPLEEWICDPFSAKVIDEKIYARGANDAKGNVVGFLKAVQSFLETKGDIPVNIKFMFEGEEEILSPHLPMFIQQYKNMLGANAIVCWDGGMDSSGRPQVNLGLKGMLYVELRAKGPRIDVHSSKAPLCPNPAWRLTWALSTIKRVSDEKITIDGWYDAVAPPLPEETKYLDRISFDDAELRKAWSLDEFLLGLKGHDALKNLLYRPTCNICGFDSGYKGSGVKTVLPSKAIAKIDFRLAYDQNPDQLFQKLQEHLKRHGFKDIAVIKLGGVEPSKTPINAPISKVVIDSARDVYSLEPLVYPMREYSGPDYLFTKRLGLHSVWTGGSAPLSNAHGPNEFMTSGYFTKGIKFAATIIQKFGET
jgi:acetylornithine deacetylase/succinyl-diaminopimelate desuccinylase-like protein